MPRKYNIKIIGEHRGPDENEFFPSTNPFNDQGMVEMFEYLESKYNFSIQHTSSNKQETLLNKKSYKTTHCFPM
mgnify:CR=1 FL=1